MEDLVAEADRRESEVVERFWAESHRKAERRREIEAMPRNLDRFDAILRDVWTSDNLQAVMYGGPIFPSNPQDLDEWLAEDNPYRLTHYGVPGVLEALGLS